MQNSIELIEDPDLKQAVDDFRPLVIEIRRKSAAALLFPVGSDQRLAAEDDVRDEMRGVATRCERIGITIDTLMTAVNDDLDRRARRGRPAPEFETRRTLIKRVTDTEAEEMQAQLDLAAAKRRVTETHNARVAAQADATAANIGDRPWWSSWE